MKLYLLLNLTRVSNIPPLFCFVLGLKHEAAVNARYPDFAVGLGLDYSTKYKGKKGSFYKMMIFPQEK